MSYDLIIHTQLISTSILRQMNDAFVSKLLVDKVNENFVNWSRYENYPDDILFAGSTSILRFIENNPEYQKDILLGTRTTLLEKTGKFTYKVKEETIIRVPTLELAVLLKLYI